MRRAALILLPILSATIAVGVPAWADPWVDPGAVDESLCQVSHAGEDHSMEDPLSAVGWTLDGVPFTGSNLTGMDFSSASLACVDDPGLSCDGRCVDFSGATLDTAIFSAADASGADFTGAAMSGVTASGTALTGAVFDLADVTGADFTGAALSDATFATADASGADFTSATLTDADFTGAILDGARFQLADASGADFTGAAMVNVAATDADMRGATFDGADLTGADLELATLDGAVGRSDTSGPTLLVGASLRRASFLRADFGSAAAGTDLSEADLRNSRTDCGYTPVEITRPDGTTFIYYEPYDCPDLSAAILHGADLRNATWKGVDLGGASFVQGGAAQATNLDGARLEAVDLTGGGTAAADLSGVDLGLTSLVDAVFFAENASAPGTYVEANLSGAILDGTDLGGAVLCSPADFDEVDVGGNYCTAAVTCLDWNDGVADPVLSLRYGSLRGAFSPGIDFSTLDLRDSDLREADFRCASFFGADLRASAVDAIDLAGADLSADGADPADLGFTRGLCSVPDSVYGEIPTPRCPTFDGARAMGLLAANATWEGASFVNADLRGADLSSLASECVPLPVDPDQNDGLSEKLFCPDFTGADLRVDTGMNPATLEGAFLAGPAFESTLADDLVLRDLQAICRDGFEPAEDGGDPVPTRFCARFEASSLVRADFTGAVLDEATFGCLVDDDGSTDPSFDCTALNGAQLVGLEARASLFSGPLDLTNDGATPTSLAKAILSAATLTCEGFTYTRGSGMSEVIDAKQGCPDFEGAVLGPDLDLSGATLRGIDWSARNGWTPDLTGADFTDATLGCFEYTYLDASDVEQSLPVVCTTLAGANLSGADFGDATLHDADAGLPTRFSLSYVPDPDDTGDAIKDNCVLQPGEQATDVRGARFAGVDLTEVFDFGGECILVDVYTTYDEDTLGLTAELEKTMTFVPEPSAAAGSAAALLSLSWLARARRRA